MTNTMNAAESFSEVFPLASVVQRSLETFRADELAYLALTSKPELALRDRIAFHLHSSPEAVERGWMIAREYKLGKSRVDLAALGADGTPRALFEFKSTYSFDTVMVGKQAALIKAIQQDVTKCRQYRKLLGPEVETHCVVAITHPRARVECHLHTVVKYPKWINKGLKLGVHCQETNEAATSVTSLLTKRFGVHNASVLTAPGVSGSAFGVPVEILWVAFRVA